MKKIFLFAALALLVSFSVSARTLTWDRDPYHFSLTYDQQGRLTGVFASMGKGPDLPYLLPILNAEIQYNEEGLPREVSLNQIRLGFDLRPGRRPRLELPGLLENPGRLPPPYLLSLEEDPLPASASFGSPEYIRWQNRALLQWVIESGLGFYHGLFLDPERLPAWGFTGDFARGAMRGLRELGEDVGLAVASSLLRAPANPGRAAVRGVIVGCSTNLARNLRRGINAVSGRDYDLPD